MVRVLCLLQIQLVLVLMEFINYKRKVGDVVVTELTDSGSDSDSPARLFITQANVDAMENQYLKITVNGTENIFPVVNQAYVSLLHMVILVLELKYMELLNLLRLLKLMLLGQMQVYEYEMEITQIKLYLLCNKVLGLQMKMKR